MPSPQLSNYLRSNRRRLDLSQGEVAFLLGQASSAQVSRHEHSEHIPSLEIALAYEAIFQRPLSEVFGGMYQKAEREVSERAKALAATTDRSLTKREAAKRKMLAALAAINN